MKFKSNKNKKISNFYHKIFNIFFYFIYFFLLGWFLLLGIAFSFPWISPKSPSFLHIYVLDKFNRSQQMYYVDYSSFSDENFLEEHYTPEDAIYYNHYFETAENIAFIYAVPKQEYDKRKILGIEFGINKKKPFYSYAGAITVKKEENDKLNFKKIICRNKSIGSIKANQPIVKNNTLSCSEGTQEIK